MSVPLEERCACRRSRFFLRGGKKASSSEGTLLERSAPKAKRSFCGASRNPQPATRHPHKLPAWTREKIVVVDNLILCVTMSYAFLPHPDGMNSI